MGPRPPYEYRDPGWDRGRGRGGPSRPWGRGGPPDSKYMYMLFFLFSTCIIL